MSLCALCGLFLAGDAELCPHHHESVDPEGAPTNRVLCDLFHRGVAPQMAEDPRYCEGCRRPLHHIVQPDTWACTWPPCDRAGIITETAVARIVIELRPGGQTAFHWWRADGVPAYMALNIAKKMLDTTWAGICQGVGAGLAHLARGN